MDSGDMPSHDLWHLADHRSLPMEFLLDTLEILAMWDCDCLVQLWRAKVQKVQSDLRLYSLVAMAHRCIHRCSPRQRARYRPLDMAINHWLQHRHGGAWLVSTIDRLLIDGGHFAFNSQEWRQSQEHFINIDFSHMSSNLCTIHGYTGPWWVEQRSPTIVLVPQWWRRDVPLCLPDTATHAVATDEVPEAAPDEVPEAAPHPTGRSSYRRAHRPRPQTAPHEAHSEVQVVQALQQGLADMQVTLARLREAQDVDCVTNMQETLAMQSEVDRITREMAPAIAMDQELQELQAAVASIHELRAENAQVLGVPDTPELALPPSAHLNSTTELVGLETNAPSSMLTGVRRQAPWSGSALASPPWSLLMPACNSPVTTQSIDNGGHIRLYYECPPVKYY